MQTPEPPRPKWSRRPPPAVAKRSKPGRWLFLLLCSVLLGYLSLYYYSRLQSPPGAVKPVTPPTLPKKEEDPGRLITLFFPLADGSGLSSNIKRRQSCPNESACLQDLFLALGESPGAGLFPTLPAGSTPLSFEISDSIATINLSQTTIQQLPGGVQSERLFLAALTNTLAVNFPQVQQLTIQIDGLPAETLKGHIDLTTPFNADFSLVRRPQLPALPGRPGTPSEWSQRP